MDAPLCFLSGDAFQIFKGEEPGRMAVGPDGLQGIASHRDQARQLKRPGRQGCWWIFVQITHDIGFAFTSGAGTGAPQIFQRDETLRAVIPFDRQLIADELEVQGTHGVDILRFVAG